jgi:hypothetical protein
MTIDVDEQKIKRAAIIALWIIAIALGAYAAFKYLPALSSAPRYAVLKTGELVKEYQAQISKENFLLYKSQDIESAAQSYYERVKSLANLIAKSENLIILDEGAIIGAPSSIIDVTPIVRRELEKQ